MNLFDWFRRAVRRPVQATSEAVIRRVVRSLTLPAMEIEPGLWSVTAERRNTYRVTLYLWAQEEKIHCKAACGMSIERDLIPRELLLLLLEENHRFDDGAFRLSPHGDRHTVVFGRVVDTRAVSESELRLLGETLIERMQRMVCKLYSMDLIISGPEPREASVRHV